MRSASTSDQRKLERGVTVELTEVLRFMRLVWAFTHALEMASKRMNKQMGVTGPQRLALRVVGLFPELSPGRLATILHVDPSTLTGILRRLADHRLLTRSADPSDRRRAVLRLTRKGERVNGARAGTVEDAVDRALRATDPRDLTATCRVLTAVTRRLEQRTATAGRRARSSRHTSRI